MSMAFRSLRRRKMRTVLTVSGIVVGVGMILVLLSLAAGTSVRTTGLLRNLTGAEITVVNSTRPSFGGGGGFGGGSGFGGGRGGGALGFQLLFGTGDPIGQSIANTIGNMSGVYGTSPQLTITGYVNNSTAFFYGVDPNTYSSVTNGINIVNGSMLSSSSESNQIVLESTFAANLNISVGSVVTAGPYANSTELANYTVVGMYSSGTNFGPQTRSAYILLSNAQSISNQTGKVTEIYVKANNPTDVSQITSSIDSSVSGVTAISSSNIANPASTLSNSLTTFFVVIGLVALLAGAFGVINTMMMSISERTREIGTLKAIGARSSQVVKIFLSEALLIGLIGAAVGVFVGILASFALPLFTGSVSASNFGGAGTLFSGGISPSLTLSNILLSLALGTLVGVLAGLYPAWRASRMNPVEALRHV